MSHQCLARLSFSYCFVCILDVFWKWVFGQIWILHETYIFFYSSCLFICFFDSGPFVSSIELTEALNFNSYRYLINPVPVFEKTFFTHCKTVSEMRCLYTCGSCFKFCSILLIYLLTFFWRTVVGSWTQGLTLARQAFYHLSHTLSLNCLSF
jgi:hypothetical protein